MCIINDKIENTIINHISLNPRICYIEMTKTDINFIHTIILNLYNRNVYSIIKIIRYNFITNKIISNNSLLKLHFNNILEIYQNKTNILEISLIYDLPPLNIMRKILKYKYNISKMKILLSKNILDSYDQTQLDIAINNDNITKINNNTSNVCSKKFELIIELWLHKNSILYKTEYDLRKLQSKTSITPDFLIESDLYINNIKINWIEVKNFFGSNIEFVTSCLKKQVNKYVNKYGTGCVIFRLGYNSDIIINNVILIDFNNINNIFNNIFN